MIERFEGGQVSGSRVAAELLAQVRPEEAGALFDDIVEDEEAIALGDEANLDLRERVHLVIRPEEAKEGFLGERVRAIRPVGPVTGSA